MPRIFQFRFIEGDDRERYGDQLYELDVSFEGLADLSMGLLEDFEAQTGMLVLGDWMERLGANELKAIRALMWLSWRSAADGPAGSFAEFQPNVLATITDPDFKYREDGQGNQPGPNRATRRAAAKKSTGPKRPPSVASSRRGTSS